MVPDPDPKQHWNNRKNDMSLFSATNQERPYEQLLLNCIILPPETDRYSNEVNLFPFTLPRKLQEEFVKALAVTISCSFGFSYDCSINQFVEQGWSSGESTRLSQMWPGFESLLCKNQHFQILNSICKCPVGKQLLLNWNWTLSLYLFMYLFL